MISSPTSTDLWPGEYRWSGAQKPKLLVLFAHGAGAGMDHPFMAAMAEQLADADTAVLRFEFDYMATARAQQRRRPPDRLPNLVDCFQRWLVAAQNAHPEATLVLMGKSMGSRVAALCAGAEVTAACGVMPAGVIALGYPFHPVGKRDPEQWRWQPLQACTAPLLILQGERDNFGHREEIDEARLSASMPAGSRLHWLTDGDHSFVPRKRSGLTEQQLLSEASQQAGAFIESLIEKSE
ncbi:alpha/beta family hydrolase [Ferrimonas gelatinilytica]|uniref:Alpha/beta fold hydrolase n=1 Tax=Ferrimonas gelatinilytica TaxID=1255257 RepID=A0ABP9RT80_9GAMM